MVGAVTLALAVGFLCLTAGHIVSAAAAMFTAAGRAADGELATGLVGVGSVARTAAQSTLLPLFGLTLLGAIVTNIVVMRGIPVSVDPIVPRISHINPAAGFARLFKLRSLMELLKSLVKALTLAAVLFVLLRFGVPSLVWSPACGLGCVPVTFGALIVPMLEAATVLFLSTGLADIGLQRWLFLRDQRMSVTESKRERKEMEGDPLIRRHRRRQFREAMGAPARMGLAQASVLFTDGGANRIIGLRYRRGETPVPAVVCRAAGEPAIRLIAEAAEASIRMQEHPDLVRLLFGRAMPGQFVPEDTYQVVAAALVQARVI
jgi:type III secretion protein U